MNKTFIPNSDYIKRKWYIIDCKDQKLGRLASFLVRLLAGKFKSYYYPSIDIGDYIILINAEFLIFDREVEKFHVFRPGRPGCSLKRIINITPQKMIGSSIKSMMPNGLARKRLIKRLKVYEGKNHPHKAQNPIKLDFNKL